MQVYCFEKKRVGEFLKALMATHEVIAPLKKDVVRFLPTKNPSDINLSEQSFFPVKEYFFKKEEILFNFNGNKLIVPQAKHVSRVFFGLRRCDLNAIRHQDMVYEHIGDPYYLNARHRSVLIGYHCNKAPHKYCFCGSMKLEEFFDLMFYDCGEQMLVEAGSSIGDDIVKKHKAFFKESSTLISSEDKSIKNTDRLKNPDISKLYDHQDWKKGVDLCLSCTACTALCPTCYCFSIHDTPKTANLKQGERKRVWSSCQVQEFSRVAGDHIFRKERDQRFKHRIYHQLDYFKERYGVNLCVGCGRCIEGCPTRIDFVDIINNMGGKARG